MGFPICYTNLFIPTLLLHILTLLSFFRNFISTFLTILGLHHFLEPEPDPIVSTPDSGFIRDMLPVLKFSDLINPYVKNSCGSTLKPIDNKWNSPVPYDPTCRSLIFRCGNFSTDVSESCAICLYEFKGDDEIRRLRNCSHIFHRCCLDSWLDHDQKTCPLCRREFVTKDMQHDFNQRTCSASRISDFYLVYSS